MYLLCIRFIYSLSFFLVNYLKYSNQIPLIFYFAHQINRENLCVIVSVQKSNFSFSLCEENPSPDLNVVLVFVSDVVVEGEEEGEREEESEAGEEVPHVVVVEVVQARVHEALLVVVLRQSCCIRAISSFLHLRLEEVERRRHEERGQDGEDEGRPGEPFLGQPLHDDVEPEVHGHVGEEDEEEDGGKLTHDKGERGHGKVDHHEDNQELKPERLFWGKT